MTLLLFLGSITLQTAPATSVVATAAAPADDCKFEKGQRSRQKWLERPPAGIVLTPGIVAGMTRDQVRQISPLLVQPGALGSFQFIPGLHTAATARFTKKTKLSYGIYLRGRDGDAAKKALTAYLGKATKVRASGHYIEQSAHITGAGRFAKGEYLEWCQAHRVISLTKDEDSFGVRILPK